MKLNLRVIYKINEKIKPKNGHDNVANATNILAC